MISRLLLLTSGQQVSEGLAGLGAVILAVRLVHAVPAVVREVGHLQVGVVQTDLGRACKRDFDFTVCYVTNGKLSPAT